MKIEKSLVKRLLDAIDWESVNQSVNVCDDIPLTTQKQVQKMVLNATEYYLPFDYVNFEIISLEGEFFRQVNDDLSDRAFIDLILKVKPGAESPYANYENQLMLCDWKTTSTDFDTRWRQRYIESWQWKRYAAFFDVSLFEFRGVSTKTIWEEGGRLIHSCHPLILQVPKNNLEDVNVQILSVHKQKLALQDEKIWTRNMPEACNKFEACPRFSDCSNMTMPRKLLEIPKQTSYSSDNTFMLCPEKYRRMKLEDKSEEAVDMNSAAFIGDMFHAGIENVYKQARKLQENEY